MRIHVDHESQEFSDLEIAEPRIDVAACRIDLRLRLIGQSELFYGSDEATPPCGSLVYGILEGWERGPIPGPSLYLAMPPWVHPSMLHAQGVHATRARVPGLGAKRVLWALNGHCVTL